MLEEDYLCHCYSDVCDDQSPMSQQLDISRDKPQVVTWLMALQPNQAASVFDYHPQPSISLSISYLGREKPVLLNSLFRSFVELIQSSYHASPVSDYFPPFGLLAIASRIPITTTTGIAILRTALLWNISRLTWLGAQFAFYNSSVPKIVNLYFIKLQSVGSLWSRHGHQARQGRPGSEGQGVAYPILPTVLLP